MRSRRPALNFLWASGFGPKGGILSRRISLSPFPTLRHHSGTLSGPSITFQAFPSLSIKFLPFQSTPFLTPPIPSTLPYFTTVSGITVPLRYSPFLSVSRFYSSPSLPISRLPVSIRFPSPCLYPFPVSIRFSPPLPVRSAVRSAVLPPIKLPITDRCCLAIIPCYSVTFPYIKPHTMVVRPQFVIN